MTKISILISTYKVFNVFIYLFVYMEAWLIGVPVVTNVASEEIPLDDFKFLRTVIISVLFCFGLLIFRGKNVFL